MRKAQLLTVFLLGLLRCIHAAEVTTFSGEWMVNVDKTNWGKVPRPRSVTVHIRHQDPKFEYSGTVDDGNGNSKSFHFEGAIDGKPYPVKGSTVGDGTVILRRVNPRTVQSEIQSADRRYSERTRLFLSRDGKTMRRYIRVNGPDGELFWTEIYEKH